MTALAFTSEVTSGRVRIMRISHAADLYLGELARQGRTPRTLASYQRTLNKLADTYPNHDVEELNATLLRRFLDGYQRNLKTDQALTDCAVERRRAPDYWERKMCSCGAQKTRRAAMCRACKYEAMRGVTRLDVGRPQPVSHPWRCAESLRLARLGRAA